MDSHEVDEFKRIAKRRNGREYLPQQLDMAMKNIEFWRERKKLRLLDDDLGRAKICDEMIGIYQKEVRQINQEMQSWL